MLTRASVSLRIGLLLIAAISALVATVPSAFAQPAIDNRGGELPLGADGKPLNFDFETGTLADWEATGEAFAAQPVEGDVVQARRPDMHSDHAGKWWIGSYERGQDGPQGTLLSKPFVLKQPFASFLIGGGDHASTRVELLVGEKSGSDKGGGDKVVFRASGFHKEDMLPVLADLTAYVGQTMRIRLVDQSSDGWGHINFDDFRVHATKPNIAPPATPAPMHDLQPDQFAASGLSPEAAAKAMTVPPGFHVTLFAGEPDVQQPIAMAFDDRGRLWVAEAYSYPNRVPENEAKDRILIFEDTDGDGHFDSRKVFAEKLNLVSGMELGFGGVFVGAAPHLLFIPDANGDDQPDGPPQILLDGWGYQDTHETLNSFIWGPDGWLYGSHGVFTHSNVGKPGAPDNERVPINAGVWRYHPTRQVFEVFAHGTSNSWGLDFNDRGQAFETACVIPHLYHMIQNGRYIRQAGSHSNPYTYEEINTIAKHRHWAGAGGPHAGNGRSDSAGGGHAHAGAMIYLGGAWPQEYRDQLFMNNIHGARLNEDHLFAQGSGYYGDRAPDFLFANDAWSQILYLTYGPDGQAAMIDWYDRNQCHHGNVAGHDRSNGRIFKVSYDDPQAKPAATEQAGAKQADSKKADLKTLGGDLKKLSDEQLIALLLDSNDWYVRHARRVLQERGARPGVYESLRTTALTHADETRRLRALWALHAVGGLDEATIQRGLANDSPLVRAWSVQLACEAKSPSPAVLKQFAQLAAGDPSPVVRLYLASACPRLPHEARVAILRGLVTHEEDSGDHNLPLMYWYALESIATAPDAKTAGAISLWPQIKIAKLRSFLVRRLAQPADPATLADLTRQLLDADSDERQQLLVLRAMNQSLIAQRSLPAPAGWAAIYARLSASKNNDIRSEAMTLALTFGDPAAVSARLKQLEDESAPLPVRLEALASLLKPRPTAAVAILQKLVKAQGLSGPVIRGLAAFDDDKISPTLIAAYRDLAPSERRDALNTLAARVSSGQALLAAIDRGEIVATDIPADVARQLHNLKDPKIDAELTRLWGSLHETPADRAAQIDKYKHLLTSSASAANHPDVSHGRAVFAKTCAQCHALFSTGGKIGPGLTGSNRANLDYLLSNIVDPSAVIGKDYLAQVIVTNDGRTLTGLVRDEDSNSLKLITANETLSLAKSDIEERSVSAKSMMPDDILKPLGEREIRSLVAYLASPNQVPLLATPENAKSIFNGRDLIGWSGATEHWAVKDGELVGKSPSLDHNEFLFSDLSADDFWFSVDVLLAENRGNSGIQFRSEALPNGEAKGYQADVGGGWWGKLYEESGRGLLWDQSGEKFVKPGQWNHYEIETHGSHVYTWINGQLCVDLDDPPGARRGVFALQLHSGEPTEVRFKNFDLQIGVQRK